MPPAISVLIVNFNAGPRLAQCLDHLAKQTFRDFEIIIVDNASSDQSIALAQAEDVPFKLIEAGANLGFAAANNLAAQQAQGDWFALLNPDAYAAPDWLQSLMDASKIYPWADAFGSTQLNAGDTGVLDGAGDVFHVFGIPYRGAFGWPAAAAPPDGECFSPCAAAALYRRSVFNTLGGFDERLFCYSEDVDLGFRLRLSGRRAIQVRNAIVHHEGSAISGRYSDFTVYHGNRNRIWVTYKNMPGLFYWPLLPFQLAANLYLLARSFSVGAGKPYWRALKDGYLGLGAFREDRRRLQRARSVKLSELAQRLTWSPLKVSRRMADLSAIKPPAGS